MAQLPLHSLPMYEQIDPNIQKDWDNREFIETVSKVTSAPLLLSVIWQIAVNLVWVWGGGCVGVWV